MRKDFRIAMLLSACCQFGMAAVSPLASTNDFYYTVPKTTNIFGRVMGEKADYRLIRQEDVAWIEEAWRERLALGGNWMETNRVEGSSALIAEGDMEGQRTTKYWTDAGTNGVLRTTAVTNALIGNLQSEEVMARILGAASGGVMTNEVRELDSRVRKRLIGVRSITNAYEMLKGMKVVVKTVTPSETNTAKQVVVKTKRVEKSGDWGGEGGAVPAPTYEVTVETNEAAVTEWMVGSKGVDTVHTWYEWPEGEEYSWVKGKEEKTSEKEEVAGEGEVKLAFSVRRSEDWLRGEARPKVVEQVKAWGVVHLKYGWRESQSWQTVVKDEEGVIHTEFDDEEETGGTNATVLVELGAPTWMRAKGEPGEEMLEYGLRVRPGEVLGSCVAATAWMPSVAEVVNVPIPTWQQRARSAGGRSVEKWIEGEIMKVYVVIRLKPVTSLPGW